MTENGRQQVLGSGKLVVGPGKLIDPAKLAQVYISPRRRAQTTFELLFDLPAREILQDKTTTTNELAEWDYGQYEGLLTKEIRALRKDHGLDNDGPWDIWRDGCEGGESAQQVTDRLDGLIKKIHDIQSAYMHGEKPVDVLLVAHGHLLRAFTKRWLKYSMETPLSMMMEPGGVGILRLVPQSVQPDYRYS